MSNASFELRVVSLESSLFSGRVQHMRVTGSEGEMGIKSGHTALLTSIKPGMVDLIDEQGEEVLLYVSGGMLEVQPDMVTVLADTAIRAEELNQESALAAKKRAEESLSQKGKDFNHQAAATELAQADAQLQLIKKLKK